MSANFQMNNALSHKLYAAADLFLMPSLFEPCGLSQLISLRYGTLPITRETGGLRDTVLAYNEYTGDGNGFTFLYYNAHDMLHVIENAVRMFHEQRDVFNGLAIRAMGGQYGWDQSAKQYIELYSKLVGPVEEAPKPKRTRKKAEPKAEEAAPAEAEKKPARKRATKATKAEEAPAEVAEAPAKKPATRKKAAPKAEDAPAEKKPRAPRKKKAEE